MNNFTDDEYSQAALRNIGVPFCDVIWGEPPQVIEAARKAITERRKWAEALQDKRWRKACLKWINYAEDRLARSPKVYDKRMRVSKLMNYAYPVITHGR